MLALIRWRLSNRAARTGTTIFVSRWNCLREVLPEFDEREEARARRKQQELTPFLEQAMMRKGKMAPLAEDRIPSFVALGRQVAETEQTPEQAAARRRMLAAAHVPLQDPAKALAAD